MTDDPMFDLSPSQLANWLDAAIQREMAALIGDYDLKQPILREEYEAFVLAEMSSADLAVFEALPV